MKNYLKAIIVAMLFFGMAAACTNQKDDETTYEQLSEIEATDGSEVKRPGGGGS